MHFMSKRNNEGKNTLNLEVFDFLKKIEKKNNHSEMKFFLNFYAIIDYIVYNYLIIS